MKKLIYVSLFFLMVLPLNVLGAEATFTLDCPTTAKKGTAITCKVMADIVPAENGEETLKSVTGTLTFDNTKFTRTDGTAFTATGLNKTGEGQEIGSVVFSTKSDAVVGNATISLNVTAATDSNDATVTINDPAQTTETIKIMSSDTTINSIKIDTDSAFCKTGETECAPTIEKSSVVIDVKAVTGATVTGNGTKTLTCGANRHVVKITAEDGTTKDYVFNITRKCSTDTTLKGITLSTGDLNPTFSSTTKNYTVDVSSEIDKITISATKNVDVQTITGTVTNRALQYGANKFTIVVTSESGASATYAITVNRKDDRSENNDLKELIISAGSKYTFDKATTEYKIKVLYETETLEVTAKSDDPKALVTITNNKPKLKVGENAPIVITVKSENQKDKVYKVIVERLEEGETLGENPNIADIKIEGYQLDFNPNTKDYTLKIEKEDKLDIDVTMEEITSTYEIIDNKELKNGSIIKIKTASADGTTNEYTIKIEKSNIMLLVIVAGVTLVGAIVLIIYLIVKNKKDKNKLQSDKIKNKIREEDLLTKVENQLGEQQIDLNSVVPEKENQPLKTEIELESQIEKPSPITREEYRQEVELKRPTPMVNVVPSNEEIENEPKIESTRVCSICGHRVSANLATCPYCKRTF